MLKTCVLQLDLDVLNNLEKLIKLKSLSQTSALYLIVHALVILIVSLQL